VSAPQLFFANLNEDVVADQDDPQRSVHTGFGVVVPVEKIIETVKHPELVAMRKAVAAVSAR
jgi:hypothetical protein